ncbi:MAG: hypothetical protein AAF907_17585, partial [Planctomycetota bacterium]
MSRTPTRRLDPESRGDLVAYLDDELPPGRRAEIDDLLADNAVARKELDSLRKTWDLLEAIPKETANPSFTAATMAAVTAERPVIDKLGGDAGAASRRIFVILAWLAIPAVWGYAATFVTTRLVPGGHDRAVRDYEVLRDLDLYEQVGSVEFLVADAFE